MYREQIIEKAIQDIEYLKTLIAAKGTPSEYSTQITTTMGKGLSGAVRTKPQVNWIDILEASGDFLKFVLETFFKGGEVQSPGFWKYFGIAGRVVKLVVKVLKAL